MATAASTVDAGFLGFLQRRVDCPLVPLRPMAKQDENEVGKEEEAEVRSMTF